VLPPFDAISISLGIEATVTLGTKDQLVTLSGDANLLQYVELAVEGGVLVTKLNGIAGGIDPVIPLRLQLLVPPPAPGSSVGPFSSIEATEKSSVDVHRASGAAADTVLSVSASDASMVQLDGGSGARLEANLAGGSQLYAESYRADTAGFVVASGSTMHVNAADLIAGTNSTVSGNSRVELSGGARCADVTVAADGSTCVQK
jgi:hypothetical protein